MLCPLMSSSRRPGDAAEECHGEVCAWYVKGERNAGGCAIVRLAHYLAGLLKDVSRGADALGEIPKLVDRLLNKLEDRGS